MASTQQLREQVKSRLDDEQGTIFKQAPERVAMLYPSPYYTGMSSLGYQSIYKQINQRPQTSAERAFLPDDLSAYAQSRTPLFTYESQTPVGDFPVIAVSVAYEMEIAGLIQCLEQSGIPALAEERTAHHPVILAGGPLTFSNPLPLSPYVDAILLGEADQSIHDALDAIFGASSRAQQLNALADISSCFIPTLHGEVLPAMGKADVDRLPATGQIITPHTELRNMFLLEAERGCSRGCKYCVMRRSTNGGMRLVPKETILASIPEHAKRVGLVGAAVSDHPKIVEVVNTLADRGCEVGLSSLRPDRLNDELCAALRRAGYKTLTTASDGASQRLRDLMDRKAKRKNLERAAELARAHAFKRLKLYMMIGLPSETDEDIDELIELGNDLSKTIPVSLGIAPFVSKRNTPLDAMPFAGIRLVEKRMKRLRDGTKGRVDIRSTSARWAWVEWVLAQGGPHEGRAVLEAVRAGGSWRAWKEAFDECAKQSPTAGFSRGARLPVLS